MSIHKIYKRRSVSGSRGVAALLTIIIVAAATLIMAYTASLLGLGELDLGYTSQKGGEAFSVADGCLEETLRRIRLDVNYSANATATLNVSNGSCIINVEKSGANGTTTVTGTTSNYNKKIQATYTLSGNVITINSWQEKDD